MIKAILLFALVSTAIALPRNIFSGRTVRPKVVGGDETVPNEFPFMVSVFLAGSHLCGGTIYNDDTIITAARCIHIEPELPDRLFTVLAGAHNLAQNEATQQLRQISARIKHSSFPGATIFSNDIGIIKLAEPLEFNANVQPLNIAPSGHTSIGEGLALGWGVLVENGSYSETLQKVTLPFVTDEECRAVYGDGPYGVDRNNICAAYPGGGKDTCQGDAGGPILANDLGTGYYLSGITSGGSGCGLPGYPGVYAEVSYFNSFIEQNA